MSVYFSGTSTGNFYEVGREYTNSRGGTSVANRDGSFTDTKTGRTSVGSSQDGSTSWYATSDEKMVQKAVDARGEWVGSKGGDAWAESNGVVINGTVRGQSVSAGTPSGSAVVPTARQTGIATGTDRPGPTIERALALERGAAIGSIFRGPSVGTPKTVTDQVLFGYDFKGNPRFTNAELAEERYAEIGANLVGLGVLASDIGYNAARAVWGSNADSMSPAEKGRVLSERADKNARDMGESAFNGLMTVWDAANKWGHNQQLIDEARQRAIAISNDAWDARQELQAYEARKQGDPTPNSGGW